MSVKSQREMLEAAIAADFDDLAAHAAYADLLAEQGDPRGEYIQLHLALEDANQSPRLLAEWRQRAHRLLQAYQRDWLGNLARFLLGGPRSTVEPDTPNIEYTWKRGWLAELHVQDVRDAFTRVLADAPEARMLQALSLRNTRLPNNQGPLEPLVGSPYLGTLKSFALGDPEVGGCRADGELVPALVRKMPQLRDLEVRAAGVPDRDLFGVSLPDLRTLTVDYLAAVPLSAFAGNQSLGQLGRLFLWERPAPPAGPEVDDAEIEFELMLDEPVDFVAGELRPFLAASHFPRLTDLTLRVGMLGDAGCREIARSGILSRLKRLDLRHCGITDNGAVALARSPDLAHLESLDVGGNRITPIGVSRLQEAEIRVQWDSQWGDYPLPDEGGDAIV
jgi:uncharacterized protein (TIGR02996 family)